MKGIMKLDVLELGGNMLRDFPAELFHHLRYLKVLNLSNNYIEMLRPEFGRFHLISECILKCI